MSILCFEILETNYTAISSVLKFIAIKGILDLPSFDDHVKADDANRKLKHFLYHLTSMFRLVLNP